MGMKSKRKGRIGELELSHFLYDHEFPAWRGQQFSGTPDVVCKSLEFHIECKRCEALRLYSSMEQAKQDAGDKPAVVFHRRNRKPWIAILAAEDVLKLLKRSKA